MCRSSLRPVGRRKGIRFGRRKFENGLRSIGRLHFQHRFYGLVCKERPYYRGIVDTVGQVILVSGAESDPNRTFPVLDVSRNAVEWSILRLHLVADFCIRSDDLQAGMGTAILLGKLSQKRNPLIGMNLACISLIC